MGPLTPPIYVPTALQIPGGLNPDRSLFVEGITPLDAKWFELSLQCGKSIDATNDIALRLIIHLRDDKTTYTTNSFISGQWHDPVANERDSLRIEQVRDKCKTITKGKYRENLESSNGVDNGLERKTDAFDEEQPSTSKDNKAKKSTSKDNKAEKSTSKDNKAEKSTSKDNTAEKSTSKDNKAEKTKLDVDIWSETESETREAALNHKVSGIRLLQPLKSPTTSIEQVNKTRSKDKMKRHQKKDKNKKVKIHVDDSTQEKEIRKDSEKLSHEKVIQPFLSFNNSKVQPLESLWAGQEFKIVFECNETGYVVTLNDMNLCSYPHHVDYNTVKYVRIDGHVDIHVLEVGGGKGPNRAIVMDLYPPVGWTDNNTILTDDNFHDLVLASSDPWLVNAYEAWCPACRRLHGPWEATARDARVKGVVRLGVVDCDRNEEIGELLDVAYYPSIYFFPPGPKTLTLAEVYQGARNAEYIITFLMWRLSGNIGHPPGIIPKKPEPHTLRKVKNYDRKGVQSYSDAYNSMRLRCPSHAQRHNEERGLAVNRLTGNESFFSCLKCRLQ